MSAETAEQVSLLERLAIHGLVAGAGAVVLWDSASLSTVSAYFPVAVGAALIALSAISAFRLLAGASLTTGEAPLALGALGLALLAAYLWSASHFGFVSSALWFVPAMALVGGARRVLPIVLLTVGFAALAYLIFNEIFAQSLPSELILKAI